MKKLLVVLVLVVSGLGYSQKFKLSDTLGNMDGRFTWVLDEEWNIRRDTLSLTEPLRDSLKREFIQVEAVKKLNAIRKEKGMKPLIFEEALRPAAYHNLVYNRYMFEHKIKSPIGDGKYHYMTHGQYYDIPNHTEIEEPWDRVELLDRSKIKSITEELTQNTYKEEWTFDHTCNRIWEMYSICDAHWKALTTNPKWDCIFVYRDFENGIILTILGTYTDEYKKEMGL
jgi:hypothetical protein